MAIFYKYLFGLQPLMKLRKNLSNGCYYFLQGRNNVACTCSDIKSVVFNSSGPQARAKMCPFWFGDLPSTTGLGSKSFEPSLCSIGLTITTFVTTPNSAKMFILHLCNFIILIWTYLFLFTYLPTNLYLVIYLSI